VLLDLLMPEMDGMTFLKMMRADQRWAGLPVIMVSGIYDGVTVGAAKDFGVKDFLIKSRFSITELLEQVRWYAAIPDDIAQLDGEVSLG
jgi:PleD family two-component response regulator